MRERSRRSIALYDDAPTFGGHERMLLRLVEHFPRYESCDLTAVVSEFNHKLLSGLKAIATPRKITTIPRHSRPFQTVMNPFLLGWKRDLEVVFRDFDLVIVVQGDIELCSLGLRAATALGKSVVSYIPLAQSKRDMKSKLATLRDMIDNRYYRLPDGFITVTRTMASLLEQYGKRVWVLPNFADAPTRITEREGEVRTAVLPGRIVFKQKRQDFVAKAVRDFQDYFRRSAVKIEVVGNGPDQGRLQTMISEYEIGDIMSLRDWSEDLSSTYDHADVVLIPSLFEGFPLVALDALARRRKLLLAGFGWASEFPASYRFRGDSPRDLVEKLDRVLANPPERCDGLLEYYSFEHFQSRYAEIVDELLKSVAVPPSSQTR